jgi:hypothetical protein
MSTSVSLPLALELADYSESSAIVKRTGAIGFCLLFAIIQVLGVVIPRFTNIHENIWPAFGLLLLAPGIALVPLLGLDPSKHRTSNSRECCYLVLRRKVAE